MQDYWVVIIAVLSAIVVLSALFLSLFFFIRQSQKKQKQKAPVRAPSRIHPKIPDPIFTISPKSVEKEIKPSDTITTRKLSMMFDARKRMSSAFSQRSSYFDFENSPQPRHKEYLDFADIEKIVQQSQKANSDRGTIARPHNPLGADRRLPTRISIIEERPFSGPDPEPVREVFSENQVSFRRA